MQNNCLFLFMLKKGHLPLINAIQKRILLRTILKSLGPNDFKRHFLIHGG